MIAARGWRRLAFGAFQLTIVAALCWAVFRNVNIGDLIESLRRVSIGSLSLAVLAMLVERLIRPYRLAILLGRSAAPLGVIGVQSVAQLVNLILPMRSGEVFLVAALRSLGYSSGSFALSIVFIDRLMDLACMLAILGPALVAALGLPNYIGRAAFLVALACSLATAGMLSLVLAKSKVLRLLERGLTRLTGSVAAARWRQRLEELINGFSVLLDPSRLVRAIVATMASWSCASLAAYLILADVWPDAPIMAAPLALCLGVIGVTLVSVPAGIGIMHAAYALAAVTFGATQEAGLAFAILVHFLTTATTVLIGIVSLPIVKRRGLATLIPTRLLDRGSRMNS